MTRRNHSHHRHTADHLASPLQYGLGGAISLILIMPRAATADTIGEILALDVTTPVARATRALAADDAATALAAIKDYSGPAAAYVIHIRALAHWKLGQPKVARTLWDSLQFKTCAAAGPSALEAQVRLTRAALVAATDPGTAADQLLALPEDPERWAQAIVLYRRAAKNEAADGLTDRLLTRFPAFPEALGIAGQLGVEAVEKRLKTVDRRLQRLRGLLTGNANEQAAKESERLLKVLDSRDPRRCEIRYIQGVTARKRRRYREAMKLLRAARTGCEAHSKDFAARAALVQTRVASILGRVDDTQYLVDWMVEKFPGHRFIDDARFLLAEVLDGKGKQAEAQRPIERL